MLIRFPIHRVLVVGTLLSLACGGKDAPTGPTEDGTPTPVATTLTLSATVLSFSTLGATEQLTPTVLDQNGATLSGASVSWASSASTVASVSSTGLITALADGTATITATSGSATGTASVIVQQAALPTGGAVSLADDAVNLVFPAGALSEQVVITAEPATGLPAGPVPISGTAFDLGPDGIVFAEPVTLTIAYDPANVPPGVPEEELRLHKLVGGAYVLVDAGVVDVTNHTASGTIDGFSVFVILGALGVTTSSPMPDGTVGVTYSRTLTATGGDGDYTWAMFDSTLLPADLMLNTETGEISGLASAAGTTNFEVEVTSAGQTATKALSIQFDTVGTLPIARFCPGDPGPESFVTFAEAFAAVIVEGIIEVCDGTHVVEGVVISKPVTIQPESDANPVIETNVAQSTFFLDGYTSGTVVIDGLTFNLSTADENDVSEFVVLGSGSYDQLIVRNSTFNIGPDGIASVAFSNNTVTGSGALVENTTFNGGDFGVVIFEAGLDVQLHVRDSHFFGSTNRALLYTGSTSGRVENSTFTDCFGLQCILVSQGAQADVISNVFAAPDFTGVGASPVSQTVGYFSGASGLVDDNDFGGCGEFRCVNVQESQVDITNNRFQVDPSDAVHVFVGHSVIRYQLGAVGTIENNNLNGCFTFCIRVQSGADVLIRSNEINIPDGHTTGWGIHGTDEGGLPTSLTIVDNRIIADMTGVVLSDRDTYRITGAGIAMDGATATVHGNTIVGGNAGVITFNSGHITSGEDNRIDQSFVGVMIFDDAGINLNFSDVTNSQFTIFDEFIASDLRCNWWGDPAGPGSTANVVDASTYMPFATAPIAGTDHSGCSPLTAENLLIGSWNATSLKADDVELLVGSVSFNFTL